MTHGQHRPPIARLAEILGILGLGMIPVETAVRAALFGTDFAQQWRAGQHLWLPVLAVGSVTGALAAFARLARPARCPRPR